VSALPLNTIEIVVNVEIVRKIVPRNLKTNRDAYAGLIEEPLSIDGSSWVAVLCKAIQFQLTGIGEIVVLID
jgi:hypothetical protein